MKGPNVGRYRHFVVIQDDNKIFFQMTRIVESFKCKSSGERSVADHGYYLEFSMVPIRASRIPSAAEMDVEL